MLGFHPISAAPISALIPPRPSGSIDTGGSDGGAVGKKRKLAIGMGKRAVPVVKGRPSGQRPAVFDDAGRNILAEVVKAIDAPTAEAEDRSSSIELVMEALSASDGRTQEQIIEDILMGDDEHLIIALMMLI